MIARYTRPAMGRIWEDENRFRIWLEIEILACEAQAELGVIPREAVRVIREKAKFDVARIEAIEAEVKHDVIAFLTSVGEFVGPNSRYIHLGMTSSDVLDTCLAVQMKQSGEQLLSGLKGLADVLARRAREFKTTVMVGRTHGIHAEPTTFGLKLALWYDETRRNIDKGVSVPEIKDTVSAILRKLEIPQKSVCALCTIAAKKEEQGLIEYAAAQGIPLQFYKPAELNSVHIPSRKSIHAQRAFGVQGVAEPSAILGSQGGILILNKVKLRNITLAVARMPFDVLLKNYRGCGNG